MSSDELELLLSELADQVGRQAQSDSMSASISAWPDDSDDSTVLPGVSLNRSVANEYLDELILALLLRHEEANGMDIIREFAHLFGVQFSPGTVYPHLHALAEEDVLECRECIRTKEYRIADREEAEAYLESAVSQLSCLETFLETTLCGSDQDTATQPEASSSSEEMNAMSRVLNDSDWSDADILESIREASGN